MLDSVFGLDLGGDAAHVQYLIRQVCFRASFLFGPSEHDVTVSQSAFNGGLLTVTAPLTGEEYIIFPGLHPICFGFSDLRIVDSSAEEDDLLTYTSRSCHAFETFLHLPQELYPYSLGPPLWTRGVIIAFTSWKRAG